MGAPGPGGLSLRCSLRPTRVEPGPVTGAVPRMVGMTSDPSKAPRPASARRPAPRRAAGPVLPERAGTGGSFATGGQDDAAAVSGVTDEQAPAGAPGTGRAAGTAGTGRAAGTTTARTSDASLAAAEGREAEGRFSLPGGLAANGWGRKTGSWASPVAIAALLVGLAAAATVLQKAPCLVRGWGAPNVYLAGCYSDWAALYGGRGFADNAWAPFAAGSTFEYPVLMSLVASVAAQITQWVPDGGNETLAFWLVNAVFVVGLWAVVAVLTVRMAGRRWTDGLMVAVAPGMILAGTINWDMWAVALMAWGMYVWARSKPGWAGVLFGLGAAMKIYPLLILGPLLILAVRSRRFGPFLKALAGTVGAWLAVNLPLMVLNVEAWKLFFTFSSERGPGLSSVWHAWDVMAPKIGGRYLPDESLSLMVYGVFAVWCAAVFLLGVLAKHPPRLAQLTFLVVAGFVLTNKVYSPQFVIWLIPLMALALPRWKDFWVWQTVEVLHFFAVWMYLAKGASGSEPQHSMDDSVYVLAIVAHMVAVLWLCARVVVEMYAPRKDLVRQAAASSVAAGGPEANRGVAAGSAGPGRGGAASGPGRAGPVDLAADPLAGAYADSPRR